MEEIEVSEELFFTLADNLRRATKGNFIGDCPICGKKNHFFINRTTLKWDCKKCTESGNIYKLLISTGKSIESLQKKVKLTEKLTFLKPRLEFTETLDEEELFTEEKKLPFGFKRIYSNDYLESRNFVPRNFKEFKIGLARTSKKFKDYIIVSVDEKQRCKGFIGRCLLSNQQAEINGMKRYQNSVDTKFSHLLFGYDLMTKNTETAILTESLFDTVRVNNFLQLERGSELVSLATFGKKISRYQIHKMMLKGVKNIVLFYDNDALEEIYKYAKLLSEYFIDVKIVFLNNKGDASSSTDEQLMEGFSRFYSYKEIKYRKLQQ